MRIENLELNVNSGKFKQTEIGMIPEDWEIETVKNCSTLTSGESPAKFSFINGKIPYFKVEQMNNCNKFQTTTPYYIDTSKVVPKGSIIFPKRGAAIETNKIRILNQDSFFDTNIMSITLNDSINNEYFYYWLIRKELWKIADTTSVPQINNKHINPLQFPLPPTLEEQTAIAKALSDVDNVISTLEKLIAKKKNIKQGTMQELLTGKKRLPGFAKSQGYKQTEIGEIPEDWEVKRLGEVAMNFTGLTYSPANINENGTLVLRSSNIQEGVLSFQDNVFVDMEIPTSAIAHIDDILICVRNGSKDLIGKAALITEAANNCAFGAFMTVLRTETMNQQYLFYVWQSDLIQKQIKESMGATINQITNSDLKRYLIYKPISKEEQTAIAEILSNMDKEIDTLNKKLQKYRAIKTGMMQQLLTGKIRLI